MSDQEQNGEGQEPVEHPPAGTPEERAKHMREIEKARRSRVAKLVTALILLGVLIAFVIQNYNQFGNVHYVFFQRRSRVLWVILASGILGWLLGYVMARPSKRQRRIIKDYEKDRKLTP